MIKRATPDLPSPEPRALADGLPLDLREEIYRLEAEVERLKAENKQFREQVVALLEGAQEDEAEIERLEAALTRLGSMEAFTLGRVIEPEADAELLARIDFARAALEPKP